MKVLITGAAGNLGSHLARFLLAGPHRLRLMVHRRDLPADLANSPAVDICRADLNFPATLPAACEGIECLIHFAGELFKPWPERFLQRTNVDYVDHLIAASLQAGVRKFILVSFPHVEGESTPDSPAPGDLSGHPESHHAQTRLEAERRLFAASRADTMVPVVLRPGMIYGSGVLMIEAGRWLMRRRMLPVWRKQTWIHLLALPDFLECCRAAIEGESIEGIYNLGDERPLTLQAFLDRVAQHWGYPRPSRLPSWTFYLAAGFVEIAATLLLKPSPITRDFIRIGMASYTADTSRMKDELLASLRYPTLEQGIALL